MWGRRRTQEGFPPSVSPSGCPAALAPFNLRQSGSGSHTLLPGHAKLPNSIKVNKRACSKVSRAGSEAVRGNVGGWGLVCELAVRFERAWSEIGATRTADVATGERHA